MKFKPIILLFILAVIATVNVTAADGADRQITITGIATSANTDPVHPGVYLNDGNPGTYWAVKPESGEAWAELTLSRAGLIYGLELNGSLGTGNSLTIFYQQDNGYWTPFLAGMVQNIPAGGTIDLSSDRIVTGRLRLRLTGTNVASAGLNELKVLGEAASNVFHRINPQNVSASRHTSYLTRAEFLTDGNTYTCWMVKPRYRSGNNWLFETIETYLGIPIDYNYNFNWPERPSYYNYGEVIFDLGEARTITNINIYFTPETRGDLTVESQTGGVWQKIGFIPEPRQPGWQRLPLNNINTAKIRLTMEATGHESVGGISEVEFWGHGAYTGNKQETIGPQTAPLTSAVNREFKLKKEAARDYRLDFAVVNGSGEPLALELNGAEYAALKTTDGNGQALYSLPLTGTMLEAETNYLRIKSQPGTLTGLKLTHAGDGVQPYQNAALNDGLVLTPGSAAAEQLINLTQPTAVEQIEIFTSGMADLILSHKNGNNWVTVNPSQITSGSVRYNTPFNTGQIKVANPNRISLNELRVLGSTVTDRAPAVRLIRPAPYEVFDCDQLADKYLVGFVDNPRAKVKVNGQDVFQIGHYFGSHLTAIGAATWEDTPVSAVATDPEGRTGRYETHIIIDKLPWFTIDQTGSTVTTGNATYQISGNLKKTGSVLKVNGRTVTNKTGQFATQVALTEGFNLIKIECVYTKPGSTGFTQTVYRKVIRQSGGLALQVDSPLNGSRIAASGVTVSGSVYGAGDLKVWINGQAATVTGERFSATAALVEGQNIITVTARNNAGASANAGITVWRDTIPPALTITKPLDRSYSKAAAVTIAGTISDASPVYLLVNGTAVELNGSQFSTGLTLPEGWNDITIKALDAAGNTAEKTVKVMVDTTAPLPFTPTADPAGWTNNNKPTITFSTTDSVSGIDHYEIAVGDGAFKGPVVSPYTFTSPIPDGEQAVKVKAVDKAGNYTIGEVRVYIDTVAPGIPQQFEVISGINRVILKWADPQGEITGYRLKRTPAFPGGSSVELRRNQAGTGIDTYIDREVTAGLEYTYTLQAIDRAENYGSSTRAIKVKVGITEQAVGSEGGAVKFDDCEVELPAGALETPGKVVIREVTASLPENVYAAKVGPAYSLEFIDATGQPVETEFAEPVNLTISFAGLTLPEGFGPEHLGVYWYNPETGDWEKLEYVGIDPAKKVLTTAIFHFSEYQVMASEFVSPSLDSYYDLGVSPSQSYFKDNVETVIPSSGGLNLSATDLRLPGRNGFDFVLRRSFDSEAHGHSQITTANISTVSPSKDNITVDTVTINGATAHIHDNTSINFFGDGWSLNIPWINWHDKGGFIRLPEGPSVKTEFKKNRFEYHEGLHFLLEQIVAKKNPIEIQKYVLTLADGTLYELDKYGRPYLQKDPSGKNTIQYLYTEGKKRELAKIIDSVGREINFTYGEISFTLNKKTVKRRFITALRVTQDGQTRTISYGYNGIGMLAAVTDPANRTTTYTYETKTFKQQSEEYEQHLITDIAYPTGETSRYTYEYRGKGASFKPLVKSHKMLRTGKEEAYTYVTNDKPLGGSYHGTVIPVNSLVYTCSITEGSKVNVKKYLPLYYSGRSGRYHWTNDPKSYYQYRGSLQSSGQITLDGMEASSVYYEYALPIQAVGKETHYCGGAWAYEIKNAYDSWGNLTYRLDGSRNLEEKWTYHSHSRIKNLVGRSERKNVNPLDNSSSKVTTTYQYDDTLGKPLRLTVNDGSRDLVTQFAYYENGNLKTRTEPNGLVTEYFYDANGNYPIKKLHHQVKEADGNRTDLETKYTYNGWGLKVSAEDPRHYITTYVYDVLNRVTKVTLPDDDANPGNNPYREYIFHDDLNTCEFYNEKRQKTLFKFDGLGRLTEIIKDTSVYPDGVKTVYHYDNLGRIDSVTDPEGHITNYQYDGLNRVTEVIFADNNRVTLEYDDRTNTVTITDEEGHKVTERSDWANRLVEAKQYCGFAGATEMYTWQFDYDSLGNKLRQVDPRQGATDQIFDALGRLTGVKLPGASLIKPGQTGLEFLNPTLAYEYDEMGNRTSETSANGNTVRYEYDELGRRIKVITQAGGVTMTTKHYYDAAGNRIRTVDPNDGEWKYTYSARGYLLSEEDQLGNITRYQYDALGNKTTVTDPRGNGTDGSFTTYYHYDDLNRLVKTVLPDDTPGNLDDNPCIEVTYDKAGNKLNETDPNGVKMEYTYTPRYWVERVSVNGQLKATYFYDKKGNRIKVKDALGNETQSKYDSLNRVRQMIHPLGNSESFTYDQVGNRTSATDGRGNTTEYTYNSLGWLTGVRDPLLNLTQYRYDPNGNQVRIIAANNLTTKNNYDELNRLIEQIDSMGKSTTYSYDLNGNRKEMIDRRSSKWEYQYYSNNLLKRLDVTNGAESYHMEYTYDEAGNRKEVTDSGNTVRYNYEGGIYQADPLNRINAIDRSFDGASYRTAYQYDKAGLLTKIKYPQALDWLQYKYDNENRVTEVVGFTALNGITYEADGALKSITYGNGVSTGYSYDSNRRLNNLQTSMAGSDILKLGYTYDNANNITRIDDSDKMKTYEYDKNNQLTRSVTPGKFLEDQPTGGSYGLKIGDYLGASWMDFMPVLNGLIGLDYNSSSIGIDFGSVAPGVKMIQIIPAQAYQTHRVIERTLNLYTSTNNLTYQIIPRTDYEFVKDDKGIITITLKERLATRFLKVHVKFDERQTDFNAKDKATFLNELAKMLRVYQEATSRTEEFQYDSAGNRTLQRIALIQTKSFSSLYYANSDRLKTDGKFAFKYDEAGNLVEKGNTYTINGDNVTFTKTSEDGVEYWKYSYDLLNRLVEVKKNGSTVAEYGYSPDGLRQVKKANGVTTHYVFEGTEPIFQKNVTAGKVKSYVFAGMKRLARVDGVIGDATAKKYYYHSDHLNSIRAVTDENGKTVYQSDYFAFGSKFGQTGDAGFEEDLGFTGKEMDESGLIYMNARFYDPETGRFVSEDPIADPNNPNLYSYCSNNPLVFIDPTGLAYTGGGYFEATPDDPDNTYNANYYNQNPCSPSSSSSSWNANKVGNGVTTLSYGPNGSFSQETYNQNPDGSSTSYTSKTENTRSPGVTKTTTTEMNFSSDGSLISRFDTTTYTKKDGGTVSISSSTIGNFRETYYTIRDQYGNLIRDGAVRSVTVIGLRGWGDGYQTRLMKKRGENPYDDAFIVANGNGRVGFISRANLEGSTAKFTDSKGKVHDGINPSIAEGIFVINYGLHRGEYENLHVNNDLNVAIEQAINPNFTNQGPYMNGCEIHKGGDGWNYSEGCLTVHESQWSNSMSYFDSNPNGVNNGKVAGSLIVTRI